MAKNKFRITEEKDFLLANRKVSREEEIASPGGDIRRKNRRVGDFIIGLYTRC